MDRKVEMLFSECKEQMNAYAMLQYIRYANFCVKAEPFALLGAQFVVDGIERDIEDLCMVYMPDDYTFLVCPKEKEYLPQLIEGIAKEHPEFKLEQKTEPANDSNQETEVLLYYHMPPVDENRLKIGTEYVNTCYDAAKVQMDAAKTKYSIKIVATAKDQEPKALEDRVQEIYDQYMAQCDEFKAAKLAELEEAHQAYLADMTNVQQNEAEEENSQGINKIYSLNLNEQ